MEITKKTFYNLEVGDIIVNRDGEKAKVIDVLPNSFLRSDWNDFEVGAISCQPQEAIKYGWTIEGAEPEEEEDVVKEAMELLKSNGYKIIKE